MSAEFRQALSARGLIWAVGIDRTQKVYPLTVQVQPAPLPVPLRGRPPKPPVPTAERASGEAVLAALPSGQWRVRAWRRGTKGKLQAQFAVVRVRVGDGAKLAFGQPLPGEEVWLVGERRTSGEHECYLTNQAAATPPQTLIATIKARWACEQGHQQLKEELGLDHFEGRSWQGLHHHALLTLMALAFLQHLRLHTVRRGGQSYALGPPPPPTVPAIRRALLLVLQHPQRLCPRCQATLSDPGLRAVACGSTPREICDST